MSKKYKMLPPETITVRGAEFTTQRIQALINIPEKNVKIGDIGGHIECHLGKKNRQILSHRGTCWIGGDAIVMGNIYVSEDALVTDDAIVKSYFANPWDEEIDKKKIANRYHERSVIDGNSVIRNSSIVSMSLNGSISDNVRIEGSCVVYLGQTSCISDNVIIQDNAKALLLYKCKISGRSVLQDNCDVELKEGSIIKDKTLVKDNSKIILERNSHISGESVFSHYSKYTTIASWRGDVYCDDSIFSDSVNVIARAPYNKFLKISDCRFSGDTMINTNEDIQDVEISKGEFSDFKKITYDMLLLIDERQNAIIDTMTPTLPSDMLMYKNRLDIVEEKFHSYQYDVVRLIKYPLMADISNIHLLNFVHALDIAKTFFQSNLMENVPSAVQEAERYFLIAESKARTTMDTKLDEKGQSKLRMVENLLAIAHDDSSSESEKSVSCQRVLKELKGVLPLEDKLIENLRISVGLKELTA